MVIQYRLKSLVTPRNPFRERPVRDTEAPNSPRFMLLPTMRLLPTLSLALFSLTVLSCAHEKCREPQPQAQCISGTVVGDACLDGVLIDVDANAALPIGKRLRSHRNVIAAVNFADFAGLNQVGTWVYFTYVNDPNRQFPQRACTANTMPLQLPHLVLGNISTTGCKAPGPR